DDKWLFALQAQLDRRRRQGNVGVAGEEFAAEQVALEIEARGSACSAGTVVDDKTAAESLPCDGRVGRVEGGAIDGDGAGNLKGFAFGRADPQLGVEGSGLQLCLRPGLGEQRAGP